MSNGVGGGRGRRPNWVGYGTRVFPLVIIDSFQIQYSIISTNTFYYLMLKLGLLIDNK